MKHGIVRLGFVLAIFSAHLGANVESPVGAQKADSFVMIANKNNVAISKMNKSDAKKLLLGQTTNWPNGTAVVVVLRSLGSADRSAVLQRVCGMSEAEFTRHNLQASFMGETVPSIVEASSATAVRTYVHANPGAVGFVHPSEVDENVRAVWPVE